MPWNVVWSFDSVRPPCWLRGNVWVPVQWLTGHASIAGSSAYESRNPSLHLSRQDDGGPSAKRKWAGEADAQDRTGSLSFLASGAPADDHAYITCHHAFHFPVLMQLRSL